MKYILIAVLICATSLRLAAQISEGGLPPSFAYAQDLRSASASVDVSVDFKIADLLSDDSRQARAGMPARVAKLIPVDYTMDDSNWMDVTLADGKRIRQLRLYVDGAVAVMLYYNDFYIPVGGKLFIYTSDRKQLLGAYTDVTNPSGGLFATEFIAGNDIILEYVEAETDGDAPRISISDIGYAYNAGLLFRFTSATTRALSGDCMVNVNCEEGEAWQNEKKGVCHTIQRVQSDAYMCTGTLMNNTAEDFRPLVLSARHCGCNGSDGNCASEQDMMQWMFYFHKELENCSNNSMPLVQLSMTGCRLRARTTMNGQSDGMLVELNAEIPEQYDVYYNGWDRRDIAPDTGVGIHHPKGDFKKISTYTESARNTTFNGEDFQGQRYAHWGVSFVTTENGSSVTEGGSSGSPLFNERKLVVGTLTGGTSSCAIPWGSNDYGKFSYHWNRYKKDSFSAMDEWLDPLGSGVETLRGRYHNPRTEKPPRNLKIEDRYPNIYLSWNAPEGNEKPLLYNIYCNNRKAGMETGLSHLELNAITDRNAVYAVTAVYDGYRESDFTWGDGIRADIELTGETAADIFPTRFRDRVYVSEYNLLARVDVLSISGQVCLVLNSPEAGTLDTSSLPAGFYFFRLYGKHGLFKVVKALKEN